MNLPLLHSRILAWYAKEGRKSLPWRDKSMENRAYRVLISEIMLQQTQVKPVLERFYFPFLERFPTLESLANAKEEEVLLQWRGLGYYTRARNLLKCAKTCRDAFNSTLPKSLESLQKLPGIGRYTAGAIACFGFDSAVSFVDSNIKRVLMRFFALQSPSQKVLESKAQDILNPKNPFDHNQALLDIGATLCTPKNPKCPQCPLNPFCKGKESPTLYTPTKPSKTLQKSLYIGIFSQDSKLALSKSQTKLYHNLYNFPTIPKPQNLKAKKLGILQHSYTKYHLKLHLYLLHSPESLHQIPQNLQTSQTSQNSQTPQNIEFFTPKELQTLPISSMTLKILHFLEKTPLD